MDLYTYDRANTVTKKNNSIKSDDNQNSHTKSQKPYKSQINETSINLAYGITV